jgi:hypothetical protein
MPRDGRSYKGLEHESQQDAEDRLTTSLAGLAMVLALVVTCLFLAHRLHHESALEDCLLSGRTDCQQIQFH